MDVVFHNAASKKNVCVSHPDYDMEVNGIGTLRLLMECEKAGVPKFIHASTGSVYGEVAGLITEEAPTNPVSYYGVSKLAGEKYVQLFSDKIHTTILRYFHVYGERQEDDPGLGGVVAVFKKQIKEGNPITIHGDGSQKRVFTKVEDVVKANLQCVDLGLLKSGQIYNCCSDVQISVMALAGALIRESKKSIPIGYKDPLPGDIYRFDVSNERIKNNLRMKFTPMEL
jgi:nucleoside-diphosphate-sugar epimerase